MNLKEKYNKEVIPAMIKEFGYKNKMAVPKISKVVVNTGIGRLIIAKTSDEQKKIFKAVLDDLSLICGQRVVLTKARKSVASFKTRTGMFIGAKATLRAKKMNDRFHRYLA